jgi:hypothetical protein|tara:strand:+ start:2061 stop:2444 length:384 start_codon:yes stop_codon:yes gene_type:complete
MLNLLIGPITELAGTWLKGHVEKGKAKVEADVAKKKAEAIVYERKANAEIDWDLEAIKGSSSSWKDEWLVILFSIPMILAFIPGMEDVVRNGFEQLNTMPEWYQYSLGVIVAASFGVRSATKLFGKK